MHQVLYKVALIGAGFLAGWCVCAELKPNNHEKVVSKSDSGPDGFIGRKGREYPLKSRSLVPQVEKGSSRATEGAKALAWVRNNLMPHLSTPVIAGRHLDEGFVKVFGLSDVEVGIINSKLEQTAQTLDELSIRAAVAQNDGANGHLVIRVPSLGPEADQVHDQLLQTFATVLGADRYQDFVSLAGSSWEQSFHSFGLAETKYEVSPIPTNGSAVSSSFEITETDTNPGGGLLVASEDVSKDAIDGKLPVVGHFLNSGDAKQ